MSPPRQAALLVVAGLAACGEQTQTPDYAMSSLDVLTSRVEVDYVPEAHVVDEEVMAYFLSDLEAPPEVLVFSREAKDRLGLQEGQVTVFPRVALRRVDSWREVDDTVEVQTSPALFTEAFENADIEVVSRINWRAPPGQGVQVAFGTPTLTLFPSAHAAEGAPWSISRSLTLKGVQVGLKLTPKSADRLEFEVTGKISKSAKMKSIVPAEALRAAPVQSVDYRGSYHPDTAWDNTRDGSGATGDTGPPTATTQVLDGEETPAYAPEPASSASGASGSLGATVGSVKVSGHISGFEQALNLGVANRQLQDFEFKIRDLEGEVRLEGAGLSDAAGSFSLKLPLEVSIPLPTGIIPTRLKLGASLEMRPQVHTGSSKFCFKATFSGDSGFSYRDGGLKNESSAGSHRVGNCEEEETVSAGRLTVAFGANATVPQLSLQIFGNTLVPSMGLKYAGVTKYEPGILSARPACQAGSTDLAMVMNVVLDFLGTQLSREAKLWQKKREWNCDGTVTESSYDRFSGEQTST